MTKAIMIQGTGSHVGKSLIVTALCRIFRQDGYKVAPFKAQNMALNSAITKDGGEIGRAQALQAMAAGIEPTVDMNPILLKANSDMGSQVIITGKVFGNMSAREYFSFKKRAWEVICSSYKRLSEEYDLIVIEGAGSPAEINLEDIVNMKVARMACAPVILVGDIDRGGLFASIVGTMELLSRNDRDRVSGFIINKFRGDESLLKGGIDYIEERYRIPLLGTIPFLKGLELPEEDGVVLDGSQKSGARSQKKINIFIVRLPHISNFTDFDPFKFEPDVNVRYVCDPSELAESDRVDLIIIPGSKNTLEDLSWIRKVGIENRMVDYVKDGGRLIGICGGYQMMGISIEDPDHVESSKGGMEGLGLLPVETILEPEKITSQVKADVIFTPLTTYPAPLTGLSGYEIHMGRTRLLDGTRPIFRILDRSGIRVDIPDGAISKDGRVWGTYIHGIFDNDQFRDQILDEIRREKGIPSGMAKNYSALLEDNINKLASLIRERIDLSRIYALL